MELLRSAIGEAVCAGPLVPAAILAMANSLVVTRGHGIVATAVVALLDRRCGTFTFSSASAAVLAASERNARLSRDKEEIVTADARG